MVDAFASNAAQEAFADPVGARRPDGRPDHLAPARRGAAGETGSVLRVVIVDEEARAGALGRRLAELLGDPGGGRRAGDADVHHPPGARLDDQEGEHGPEEEIGHLQEVARPELAAVGAQERGPGLAGGARWPHAPPVPPDGALADPDAELEHLAADALGAPEPVLARQITSDKFCLSRFGRLRLTWWRRALRQR